MLCMFEEHSDIDVIVCNSDIVEDSDGLAGELYTTDGWIHKFSKERYEEV